MFPKNKAKVITLCGASTSLASSFFTYISIKIINPDNEKPNIIVPHGKLTDKYYDFSIIQKFPEL